MPAMARTRAELLELLAATPGKLANLVAEAGDATLDVAAAGEWSGRTILAHFRDVEVLADRLRLERILAEEAPIFANFDEDRWAVERNRRRDQKAQLLADFALQRQASLSILGGLRPADWSRSGSHPSRGQFTVDAWLEQWVDHDLAHIAQLEAALGETLEDVLRRRAHPR